MCNMENLHKTAHILLRISNNIGLGKIEKMKFAFLFFFPCDSPLKNTYADNFRIFLKVIWYVQYRKFTHYSTYI